MDIHPPHRPISSVKELIRELVTITAGILIALSLEGLLEWQHHRALVREARANIINELDSNERELTKEDLDLAKMDNELGGLIALVQQFETNRDRVVRTVPFIWSIADLHATSWDTAQATGALAYMSYAEAKQYAQVYDLQRDFRELQQRAFGAALDVEGLETFLGRTRPIVEADLADAERKLGVAKANVGAMKEFAAVLHRLYRDVLPRRSATLG